MQKKQNAQFEFRLQKMKWEVWICGIRRLSRRYGESDTGLTGCKKTIGVI